MFSPALGRVVRATAPCTSSFSRVTGSQQSLVIPAVRQRRLSSSKASIPPNGSNGSNQDAPAKVGTKKLAAKGGKKKAAPAKSINVPHVPPTSHLDNSEVKLSSFFSLHRPISVASSFPGVVPTAAFDSLFDPQAPNSRRSMMNNINTLSSGLDSLESAMSRARGGQGPEVIAEVHHLDGVPQHTLEDLMAQLVPFNPPPPPIPMGQVAEAETVAASQEHAIDIPVQQRAWTTEVVVTELTDAHGNRTYQTTTTPMVEIEAPINTQETDDVEIRQPFLERMRQRQYQRRSGMMAISVKRQRKLKMKKHKYKKLMKRTRLLRRKLDRL